MSSVRSAVIVAPSPVPLRLGGAERHWDALRDALVLRGIFTDVVKLPLREGNLVDLVDAYEQFALLDLSHADLVVTGKYPAWMVQHPNHVVWMLHPLRGLYDTFSETSHEDDLRRARSGAPVAATRALDDLLSALAAGPVAVGPFELVDAVRRLEGSLGPEATDPGGALAVPGSLARAVVHHLDHWALSRERVRRHAAISTAVAGRPGYFPPGTEVAVVHPPSCLPDPGPPAAPGDRFLAVARLDRPKRVDLAIGAVKALDDPAVELVVAGEGPDRERLEALAGGDRRITFVGRVTDEELAALYRSARAVLVTPEEEDFGYVAIEAMQHGRPVITTTDSGGPTELVVDGREGLVTPPTTSGLRDAVRRLHGDADFAREMGARARESAERHDWPSAVSALLEPDPPPPDAPGSKGRVVAVSTYPVLDRPGGGPQRARHLLGALATEGWDVRIVCFGDASRTTGVPGDRPGGGLVEVAVEPSDRHSAAETRLRRLTEHVAVTDIAASVLWRSSPEFVRELGQALRGARAVVAVQPYLAPAVVELARSVPLVYDAHNHEASLKEQMLPDDEAGAWMLDRVHEAESVAALLATAVVTATEEDRRALTLAYDLDPSAVSTLPNGVDANAFAEATAAEAETARRSLLDRLGASPSVDRLAIFVGSAHLPNIDAGRLLVQMAPELPEVLFVLAGGHSDHLAALHLPANVRLLGEVADVELHQLLAGADVALNPMLTGGGSNLKLLQYFAAGVPVVTTPLGARGLPRPQAFAVLAEAPELPAAIRESLRGENRARVEAARSMVRQDYDWQKLGGSFVQLVERAIEDGADGATHPRPPGTAQERPPSP